MQILDLPVPHMMDQLAELLNLEEDVLDAGRLVDHYFQVPEVVIEVPKIRLDVIPLRTLVPEPQLAEQLVEVPTTVSYFSLQRTVEQHVDIPVPGGGGSVSSLHGFLPRQRSTASPSRKRISERIVEQIVDPVSRGGLPGSSSSHSPAGDEECADEPGKGFFRTFPQIKKCEGCSALGVGTASALQLMDGGGSAGGLRRVGAAQGEARWQDVLLEQTY